MSAAPNRPAARRLAGVFLLALVPLALSGTAALHLGHSAADAETPVFAEASHAGQAHHWDAADSGHNRRCPDCLAPPQPLEAAPTGAIRLNRMDGWSIPAETGGPTESGSGRSQRSRAPPLS